ncbi:MAG: hypothetical protein IRY99_20240 [Isosphaeraceae bacterium]|nr:hypothetical protein [Isosphaeraceae bacterium]
MPSPPLGLGLIPLLAQTTLGLGEQLSALMVPPRLHLLPFGLPAAAGHLVIRSRRCQRGGQLLQLPPESLHLLRPRPPVRVEAVAFGAEVCQRPYQPAQPLGLSSMRRQLGSGRLQLLPQAILLGPRRLNRGGAFFKLGPETAGLVAQAIPLGLHRRAGLGQSVEPSSRCGLRRRQGSTQILHLGAKRITLGRYRAEALYLGAAGSKLLLQ